jgi:redox-sensing transcriptional repressor
MAAQNEIKKAPVPSVRRLPKYLLFLKQLKARGREAVSCTHIAEDLRLDPTQVRKDLSVTGIEGRPRVGYSVPALIGAIEDFLGWNNTADAFLVGSGHLGTALMGYPDFGRHGLNIVAAFDKASGKVGQVVHGKEIMHVDQMPELAMRLHVHIGILTVPPETAQATAEVMIASGIQAIWNFTPVKLLVPDSIIVENVELLSSLALLSSRLKAADIGE